MRYFAPRRAPTDHLTLFTGSFMSEDRTQAPSLRRRQEAKAQGVVARSPELTASVGLLAAVVMLGFWGGSLSSVCVDLLRSPFHTTEPTASDPEIVTAMIRGAVFRVVLPLATILGGIVLATIVAHQAQVGGFWSSSLIAPDLARLWSSSGADWSSRALRGVWGIAKTTIIVVVAAWAIRSEWPALSLLSNHEAASLAATGAAALRRLAFSLGVAILVLGLIDYFLARRRVESALQTTPEESREEAKSVDGDPAVRARRLRLAKSWRADPGEILKGAVLVVSGPAGLAIVLGGEGPPGKVIVRASAKGASGAIVKKSAARAGLKVVESSLLARHFATASARTQPLSDVLKRELAELWPQEAQT